MWIETEANVEYVNSDMIERVTVEDTALTAHIGSIRGDLHALVNGARRRCPHDLDADGGGPVE